MAEPLTISVTRSLLEPDGSPPEYDVGLELAEQGTPPARCVFLEEDRAEVGADQIAESDGLLLMTSRVTEATLQRAQRLAVIGRFGVGYDTVDVDACTDAGVAVTITQGAVDSPVAEGVAALMLALAKQMRAKDRLVREARWGEKRGLRSHDLRERVVGVVGLGRIGRRTLEVLHGFRMGRPVAYDPYVDAVTMRQLGVDKVSLPELMALADYVVITSALTPETKGLIGAAELARMRPEACLINVSRGPLVDQQALYEALRAGRIAGAGLDVFETEPTDATLPFRELDNVVLAPHAIAQTTDAFRDIGHMAVTSILDVFAGRRPHGLLNPQVWENPAFREKLRAIGTGV